MNEIYFKQKASKLDKSGRAPIFLEFNYDAQTLVFATGEKCKLTEWDTEKQKFRRSMPGFQEANEGLENLRDKLRKTYREARNADIRITNDLLRAALSGKQKQLPVYLIPLFEDFIKLRISEGFKPSTIVALNTTLVRLRRYETATSHKLRIDSYTGELHRLVLNNLQEQDLEPISISNVCKHLITFFRYCRESLGLTLHANHAKIVKETFESDRIYLSESDLQKLETAALPQHLDRVRDAFLFQCYTGLRYSDLWRLEHRHIEQRDGYQVICIIPQKSVSRKAGIIKRIEIPLLDGALRILERYAGNYRLLPVLSNQKMNDSLKDVAQLVGLNDFVESVEYVQGVPQIVAVEKWKRISSHVARHTYATLSLMKGVPLEVVSKALGHSNTKPTLIYAKIVDAWKNQTILKAWQEKAVL